MISVIVFLPMLPDTLSENADNYTHPHPNPLPEGEGILKVGAIFSYLLLAFCLLALSIISGCAGNVILSDDAMRIRNTVDMVNQLKGLYEQHDEGMLTLFSAEYISERGMKDAILQDMEKFNTISLNIFIDRIVIDKDMGNVTVHWKGSWGDSIKTFREGGSAVIVIRYGDGLRVMDIKGESPFGITQRLFGNKE